MAQEHTPGPWVARKTGYENDSGGFFDIDAESGKHIAETIGGLLEEEANARLIAAAPELLEALELCINAMFPGCPDEEWSIAYEKASAVIAKATNQPKE